MNSIDINEDIERLEEEFKTAEGMTLDQLRDEFNTDETREEILASLQKEMEELQERYENAVSEENQYGYLLDPAFSSWEEVNSQFVCAIN